MPLKLRRRATVRSQENTLLHAKVLRSQCESVTIFEISTKFLPFVSQTQLAKGSIELKLGTGLLGARSESEGDEKLVVRCEGRKTRARLNLV